MNDRLKSVLFWLGWIGLGALLFVVAWLVLDWVAPVSGPWVLVRILYLGAIVFAIEWALRRFGRHLVWRLRNRLLVTYLFIAVVPLLLVGALVALGSYLLMFQMAINIASDELDRRVTDLVEITDRIADLPAGERPAALERTLEPVFAVRFPGLEAVLRETGREFFYPDAGGGPAVIPGPLQGWPDVEGIVERDGNFYIWSHRATESGDVTLVAPLSDEFLGRLAPDLGVVEVVSSPEQLRLARQGNFQEAGGIPASSAFDSSFLWFATVPAYDWEMPGREPGDPVFIAVGTRVSAVLGAVFNRQADFGQGLLLLAMLAGLGVFVLVELGCWAVGVGMTRSVTGAVHRLYEGTQKVMQGDFSHRIEVTGNDQLAELGHSFNKMTENVQQLLAVAQEKERLQSEIEIAREVQSLLFPRRVPTSKSLQLSAVCHPARLVSGDYYDYESIHGERMAIAIGDVAGKGISAALLMATVQSSLRTQLQAVIAANGTSGNGNLEHLMSTAGLVTRLNQHLFANTSSSKYATFCLGLYEEASGTFRYTNAGHLPPILVRGGKAHRLEVNGTVVGAFSFAQYSESQIVLERGDLLVGFTDGITEPENAFGEMFGEQRLVDLLARNAHHESERIIEVVLKEVRQWTGSDELQDDMTLLVARRV